MPFVTQTTAVISKTQAHGFKGATTATHVARESKLMKHLCRTTVMV